MHHTTEQIIKSRLEHNQIPPQPQSWDKLIAILDHSEPKKIIKPDFSFLATSKTAAAAVVLIIFATLGAHLFENKKDEVIVSDQQIKRSVHTKPSENREGQNQKSIASTGSYMPSRVAPDSGKKEIKALLENILASRENIDFVELPTVASQTLLVQKDQKIVIDATDILNQEVNRLLVNSVNPAMNTVLLEEVRKLDLAQLIEELDHQNQELEPQFRKKVVKTLNSIYAQISERNLSKEN